MTAFVKDSTADAPAVAASASTGDEALLDVRDLTVNFQMASGAESNVLSNVSFQIRKGETLALVGESGSGKSVTTLCVNRLIASPPARIPNGQVLFGGKDLLQASPSELRKIRGKEISTVFQEPMTSLHPTYTVGDQIVELIRTHTNATVEQARAQAVDMLRRVGIPDPERRLDEYPYKLSGGMCQRVMIAMALVCHPKLLIADEITTALDVTIQAQILSLLRELQASDDIAVLFITHDLNVVAEVADRVAVMYSGRIVEEASVRELFDSPQHPYTIGLLAASPTLEQESVRLPSISGQIPDPANRPAGCQFHPRCPLATEQCRNEDPALRSLTPDHRVACWLAPLENIDG